MAISQRWANDTLIDFKSIEVNIKATNVGNKKDVEIAVSL